MVIAHYRCWIKRVCLPPKNNSLSKGMVHHKYNNSIQLIHVTQLELLISKPQEMEYIYVNEICRMCLLLFFMCNYPLLLSLMAFNLDFFAFILHLLHVDIHEHMYDQLFVCNNKKVFQWRKFFFILYLIKILTVTNS